MGRQWTITAVRAGLCILSVGLGAGRAAGLATYWQHDPAEPGDWFAAGNWTGGVPGADDHAYIDNGGEAQISGRAGTARTLWLGQDHGDSGTLRLGDGGGLSAALEIIAAYGTGRFTQTRGTNEIEGLLSLGYRKGGHGTYELGGGELSTQREAVGDQSAGTFIQTGGTNAVSDELYVGHESGSEGTFELSGDGQLSAYWEYVGDRGKGTFVQTGGSNTTRYLWVNSASRYDLSGGILTATDSAEVLGRLDFANGNALVTMGGLVNLGHAGLTGTGSTSFTLMEDSLLVVPAGFDPATDFRTFINYGCPVLQRSSMVTIPPDKGFRGRGTVEGHITCQGTIQHHVGSMNIWGGLDVSGSGSVDLGCGTLTVEDSVSGVSDTAQLSAGRQYVGREGNGTFTQTGGTNTLGALFRCIGRLYLGYSSGSEGTYHLNGAGELSADRQYIGREGNGTFTQTGGSNTVGDSLYLGYFSGSEGTFTQTGGTNTIDDILYLGCSSGSEGTYELSGTGQLSARIQYLGYLGKGTSAQTGGSKAVSGQLYIGCEAGSEGTYELSGAAQLSSYTQYVGYLGNATFAQTGGNNAVSAQLYIGYEASSEATYELSGTGKLIVGSQYIGESGTGSFIQTGGTNTSGYLSVNGDSRYELRGGTLTITDSAEVLGTLDFADGNGSATMGGLVNLGEASLMGPGSTSFTLRPDSLLIVPAGFDPAAEFGSFINQASLVHQRGSALTVPAGQGFTGHGTIEDDVACEGTIRAASGKAIDLKGALNLSGRGIVDCSSSELTIDGVSFRVSDQGQLWANEEHVGGSGTGTFTQTGGTNTVNAELHLGYDSSGRGTYELSGTGELAAGAQYIGSKGKGTFTQAGGTNTVGAQLYVGREPGSEGTYHLNGTGQLSAGAEYIGCEGNGTFTQTGGANTVGNRLYVGYYCDSDGMYHLNGDGQLSTGTQYVGYLGNGTFAQTGGTNAVSDQLYVGCESGSQGTYELSGTGQLSTGVQYVGYLGNGTFSQTGGTNTDSSTVYLGYNSGSEGTYLLSEHGQLSTGTQYIGREGNGTFTQTDGTNTVTYTLFLGYDSDSEGTYDLKGSGQLAARTQYIAYEGKGTFAHAGGINGVSGGLYVGAEPGSEGTYELSGTGKLTAGWQHIGESGTGSFIQTGGANTTGYLAVNRSGRYQLSGGTLAVENSAYVLGTLDFGDASALATMGGVVNMGNAVLTGAGSASFTLKADSLLIVPAGFDPAAEFGTFTNQGAIVHPLGSLLIVGPGQRFAGTGTIEDHVVCEGTIAASDGKRIDLNGGLNVRGNGAVDLGSGRLTVEDSVSGLSDAGQLSTGSQYIGRSGAGVFTHTGGTNTVSGSLHLGYDSSGQGTYELSGAGELSALHQYVGSEGKGTFTQTGGTNTVDEGFYLGRYSGSEGTYHLNGNGQFSASTQYIGREGNGTFIQAGGINTVADGLYLGYSTGSEGTYYLNGTGRLSADMQYIGYQGNGTFTQTGGTNTVGYLSVNRESRYELRGGTLTVTGGAEVLGALDFGQGNASATMGGLVNLGHSSLSGAGSTSFTLKEDSLLVVPADFDAANDFGTFINYGCPVLRLGSFVTIPADKGFRGTGTVEGHVTCEGTIRPATEEDIIDIVGGLSVSGSGSVDLGAGMLTVEDTVSGVTDTGQLSAGTQYIGREGNGTFSQVGGNNTVGNELYLGYDSGSEGTYYLGGAGQLSTQWEYIGYRGTGTFTQTGGTHTVSKDLRLGYWSSYSQGTYLIAGGYLAADNLHVGRYGRGELGIIGAEAEICIRGRLTFSGNSVLTAVPGSTIHMSGAALENKSRNAESLSGLANLRLLFEGGGENVAPLEIAGRDLGPVMDGFQGNFALGTLQVGGTGVADVQLVNQYDNQPYWTTEALYVWNLDVGPGSRLDLNGLGLYYFHGLIDPAATITGGTPLLIPEPTTFALSLLGMIVLVVWIRRARRSRDGQRTSMYTRLLQKHRGRIQ